MKLLEGLGYVVDVHRNLTSQVKDCTKQLPPAPGVVQRPSLCVLLMGGSGTTGTPLSPVALAPARSWRLGLHTAGHRWLMFLPGAGLWGMATVMKDFANHKEHWTSDSTFLVFMSHGVRAGLCGTKSKDETTDILSVDTIYEKFNNKCCRALLGKPKVVIIQSCRGGESLLRGAYEASELARLSQGI